MSISILSGKKGILRQAENAETQKDISEEKEIINLAVIHATEKSQSGYIDETHFTDELEKKNATVTKSGSNFKVTFPSERQYIVDQAGNLTEYKPVPLTGITLASTEETVEVGRSKTLTIIKEPTNTTESVKWISETPSIATVEETTGKVTGVTIGTAIIKATSQDGSLVSSNSCTVTVTEVVSEIEKGINPETYGRIVNYNVDLGTDEDGNNLTWKVFYDDGTNVYLIASDYVQTTNVNLSSTINAIGAIKSGKYNICWGDFKTYQSESATSTIASTGSNDIFVNRPTGTAYLTGRGLLSFWKDAIPTSS
ncbi:MAG: Ig domain-containing protein, partial [Clostridia bacterium]|nr:Ig domain-containing protein [Clostridia bacterium]